MAGNINISGEKTLFFTYESGKWNVTVGREIDQSHHLSKGDSDVRYTTDHYGDLNRCIAATPGSYAGSFDVEAYQRIRSAYVKALKAFKPLKAVPFAEKHEVSVPSPVTGNTYDAKTNKNHHGIKLNYGFPTEHHFNKDGFTKEERTESNYANVAETIFNVEIGEFVSKNESATIDDVVAFMESSAEHIKSGIAAVVLTTA